MLTFCEWGASNRSLSQSNGANNGQYVEGMGKLMKEFKDVLLYENYFNSVPKHQIWPDSPHNPKVQAAYLKLYRGS
jgi:hypothetical protein